MRILALLVFSLMVADVFSTHYRGGTLYWERIGKSKIRIYWRLSFQRTHNFPEYFCENIGDHHIAEGTLALTCLDCASNKTILSPLTLECSSISPTMEWSLFDGYIDYQPDRHTFTIALKTIEACVGSTWIYLRNYGSGRCWSLITKVDISVPNDSPRVTAGLPVYRVRHGCRLLIDLKPIDVNGDPIKCRWANEDECTETESQKRYYRATEGVCGPATDLTTLYTKQCKIDFIAGCDDRDGWYAASVMIEDFTDTTYRKAKSTVPFQFLVEVTKAGSCVGPVIELADECSTIGPGETWKSLVIASISMDSCASIVTEIQGSYPSGMTMTYEPNKKTVKAKLSFRPKEEGTYVFSFTATDNNGFQSNPKSGRLIVSWKIGIPVNTIPLDILMEKSIPAPNELYRGTDAFWVITFNSLVTRPEEKTFIKILEIGSTKVIAKYNALDQEVVKFSESDPTVVQYPAPTGLEGGKTYLVNVDEGLGVRDLTTPYGHECVEHSNGFAYIFQMDIASNTKPSEVIPEQSNTTVNELFEGSGSGSLISQD